MVRTRRPRSSLMAMMPVMAVGMAAGPGRGWFAFGGLIRTGTSCGGLIHAGIPSGGDATTITDTIKANV